MAPLTLLASRMPDRGDPEHWTALADGAIRTMERVLDAVTEAR